MAWPTDDTGILIFVKLSFILYIKALMDTSWPESKSLEIRAGISFRFEFH